MYRLLRVADARRELRSLRMLRPNRFDPLKVKPCGLKTRSDEESRVFIMQRVDMFVSISGAYTLALRDSPSLRTAQRPGRLNVSVSFSKPVDPH